MTLTELAYYLRRSLPIIVLSLIIIAILYISIQIVILTRPISPVVAVPTPTPAFGQIPPISVSGASALPENMKYVMNTIEGVPLTATSSAQIYFVPKQTPNLGFREKAGLLAKTLNFDENSTTSRLDTENDTYTLVDRTKRLIVDIDTFNYTYSQDFDDQTTQYFTNGEIPDEEQIKNRGQEIFRSLNRYPPELAQGIESIRYISYKEASGSAQATADIVQDPQDANMVAIDVFPPKLNDIETVTEDFVSSPNRVVFIPQKNADDFVVKAQVAIYDRSEDQHSYYPLKSGEQVFSDLHARKGFLIQGGDMILGKSLIKINKMYLAYLIPGSYVPYIQPVYVFIGEDNFVAYVPAVLDTWVQGPLVLPINSISPTSITLPSSFVTPTNFPDTPTPSPIAIPVR